MIKIDAIKDVKKRKFIRSIDSSCDALDSMTLTIQKKSVKLYAM